MNEYDKKHLHNLTAIERAVRRIFMKAAEDAARIGMRLDAKLAEGSKPFSFTDYPSVKPAVEKLMRQLKEQLEVAVVDGVKSAWTLANNKNDALSRRVFGDNVGKLTPAQYRRYFSTNAQALEAFLARKTEGLSLSDRVWNYTNAFREQIELGLEVGIRSGTASAGQMAEELKQWLVHPDKLFRRVRDEEGLLQLSSRAKAFHPGRGVYRSSYMNARRLAATETNTAYRTADHLRWQQMDFVVGIEICLSNNHTVRLQPGETTDDPTQLRKDGTPKAGAVRPLHDICDELKGRYPKSFKFTGWHPHCRCYAVTILKTDEELDRDTERILDGKEPMEGSANEVTAENSDGLKKFNQWIDDNRERAKGWETMPYFVRDNPHYVTDFRVDTYSASERKFTRAYHTSPAMKQSLAIYLQKKYPNMPNTEKAALCDYTRGDVSDFRHLNKELMNDNLSEFNIAFSELLSNALSKLPTEEITTYRTIRLNRTNLEVWKQQAEKRAEIIFQGFTSTSDNLDAVREMIAKKSVRKKNNETDVLLVIKGKTGHRIEDFSKFHEQRELLFDKGMRLKYERLTETDGLIVFWMTEI